MATTGELRAIIQELELVDIGDAASYLGEEAQKANTQKLEQASCLPINDKNTLVARNCSSCYTSIEC